MGERKFYIEEYDCVDSTNRIAKEKGFLGVPDGTVIVAQAQTAGRGRLGRSFFSPGGSGIYMSLILRCGESALDALEITTRAAVSVARVLERHSGRDAKIKWVNDIYMEGKKVSGILTEGVLSGDRLSFAVLGIGINLSVPRGGFSPEIKDIAGAVFHDGEAYDKKKIIDDILNEFSCEEFDVYSEYCGRDMLVGCQVNAISAGEILYCGKVLGIERDFSLRIMKNDGKEAFISSGEVSVKLSGGSGNEKN